MDVLAKRCWRHGTTAIVCPDCFLERFIDRVIPQGRWMEAGTPSCGIWIGPGDARTLSIPVKCELQVMRLHVAISGATAVPEPSGYSWTLHRFSVGTFTLINDAHRDGGHHQWESGAWPACNPAIEPYVEIRNRSGARINVLASVEGTAL